jgi:hypothetical protein
LGQAARRFFGRALTLKVTPTEVVTDAASVYGISAGQTIDLPAGP